MYLRCTDCDVKYTKSVACGCMKDQLLNPVNFNAMKISVQTCVAKAKGTYLTPQQEQAFINQILSIYCDGDVKPTNSASPPPPSSATPAVIAKLAAATPKPTTKKPTPTTKKPAPTTKKTTPTTKKTTPTTKKTTPTTKKPTSTARNTTPKPTTNKSG